MARGSIVLARINELYASGVTSFEDIEKVLKTEGIKHSPASLKTQLYKLRKSSGEVPQKTGGGKGKFKRTSTVLPIPATVEPIVSGPLQLVRWHEQELKGASRFVVCLKLPEGHKYIKLIPIDSKGLTIIKVKKEQERYMQVLEQEALDTTLEKFRGIASRLGCTGMAARYIGLDSGIRKPWLQEEAQSDEITA